MKYNPWTLALIGAGLVSLPAVTNAEETPSSVPISVLTAVPSTTLSGYVDTSAQWNIGSGNLHVPTYAFGGTGKADGFNLNVVKLSLEKPVDAADAWGAGYKVDLIFGPDANAFATQSSGVATSDFGVKQAYVSLHAPVGKGLDFKVGVWDTIIGYEVFESGNNPNFTRSYGYTMEPTTHTGLQGTYQFCEAVSATVAVANTFGPTINGRANPPKAESYKTYMGSLTFTAPTNMGVLAGSTITGCIISGYNAGLGADETSYYIGGTLATPITGLKVGACYDYLGIGSQPGSTGGYANAVAGYVAFTTGKWGFFGRGEYATSDIGILGARRVLAATGTVQYDLWKNVMSRVELRWDHAADGSSPYGGNPAITGDLGTKKNSFILMANVIYKF
jgi:hypothetical protein